MTRGKCKVYSIDIHAENEKIGVIREGEIFGEVALVTNSRRAHTVEAKDYCTVGVLSEKDCEEMI